MQEPWSLHSPFGIHPPGNLFYETDPVVNKPVTPIRVAILDTGILSSHLAFFEKVVTWEDEEGDIFYGFDACIDSAKKRGLPRDQHGHGTHIAGIIAGSPFLVKEIEVKKQKANENDPDVFEKRVIDEATIRGVASMPDMVQLLICKNLHPGQNKDFIRRTLQCIQYARERGVQVINCSWGGAQDDDGEFSQTNLEELKNTFSNDYTLPSGKLAAPVVVVFAAGNLREGQADEKRNKDIHQSYPAGFPLSNAIAVASTNKKGNLAKDSYYGKQSIQISAPGVKIISTSCSGDQAYRLSSGTSMAAPHIAAALALMRAQFPQLSCEKLIEHLCEQADNTTLPLIPVQYGRLHLANALEKPTSIKTSLDTELDRYQKKLEEDRVLFLKKKQNQNNSSSSSNRNNNTRDSI